METEIQWGRVNAFARVIESYAGDEARLREQVRFFHDLTPDEVKMARSLADWKLSPAGREDARTRGE